jgi:hypothetical protein
VNWKTDLKLADLEATTAIEIVCKRCALVRYETPPQLMAQFNFQHAYLDEVEFSMCCSNRFCRGGSAFRSPMTIRTRGLLAGWRKE